MTKGFTLIEVLIAIFILATAAVGVSAMFPTGLSVQRSAKMTNTASWLAQAKIEEIASISYDEISPGVIKESYGFDPDFPSYQRETKIELVDPNNNLQSSPSDLGIKKAEVTVFWKPVIGPLEKKVEISTLISQK